VERVNGVLPGSLVGRIRVCALNNQAFRAPKHRSTPTRPRLCRALRSAHSPAANTPVDQSRARPLVAGAPRGWDGSDLLRPYELQLRASNMVQKAPKLSRLRKIINRHG
jgi:hypothetical protein